MKRDYVISIDDELMDFIKSHLHVYTYFCPIDECILTWFIITYAFSLGFCPK